MQNQNLEFKDIPFEFISQLLTPFQKQAMVIRFLIVEQIDKAENKSREIKKMSGTSINGTYLTEYSIKDIYYSTKKMLK